jgi:hypothetical protein
VNGGCACGAVRYRLASAPFDAGWCHCRTCQLNSGSPAMAFASVPVADYVIEAGTVATFASSDFGHRGFCAACGTPLYMLLDHEPTTIDFSIATLDDPAPVVPGFHIFWASALPWARIADGLPRYPRSRADGRDESEAG